MVRAESSNLYYKPLSSRKLRVRCIACSIPSGMPCGRVGFPSPKLHEFAYNRSLFDPAALYPAPRESGFGALRQSFREGGEKTWPRFDQHDTALASINRAKLVRHRRLRQFGDDSCQFDSSCTAADEDESLQCGSLGGIMGSFGPLKGHEHTLADADGVAQCLETGSVLLPVIMSEVVVSRAGGQIQSVIAKLTAIVERTRRRSASTDATRAKIVVTSLRPRINPRNGQATSEAARIVVAT